MLKHLLLYFFKVVTNRSSLAEWCKDSTKYILLPSVLLLIFWNSR